MVLLCFGVWCVCGCVWVWCGWLVWVVGGGGLNVVGSIHNLRLCKQQRQPSGVAIQHTLSNAIFNTKTAVFQACAYYKKKTFSCLYTHLS